MALNEDDILSRVDALVEQEEARGQPNPLDPNAEPVDQFLAETGAFGDETQAAQVAADSTAGHVQAVNSFGDLFYWMRQAAMDERWRHDENTLLNFAFKNGHHYVEVDRARRAVVPLPMPRSHVRRKVPKFQPWFRTQHSKLTKVTPDAKVVPVTNQQEDKDAAEYAERLREWVSGQLFHFGNRSERAMWQLLGGVAVLYIGVEWEEDEEYFEATGGQMMHRPDLIGEVLSPLHVWCDNKHAQIGDMRWFGRDFFIPEPEARALYMDPEDQRELTDTTTGQMEERGYWTLRDIQRFLYREDPWLNHRGHALTNHVLEEHDVIVSEAWGRRGIVMQGAFLDGLEGLENLTVEVLSTQAETGREALIRFPNGFRLSFTPSGHVLELKDNHLGTLPFVEYPVAQSAGFWTPAWATPLREINQAFDWAFSLREEHLLRTAHPPFLMPREARVRKRTSASGTSVRYEYKANRFNMKPEWANPPTMPQDTIEFLGELERIWQDVAGVHEVSEGRLPAKLSGVAISLLQEQDAEQLGFTGQALEEGDRRGLAMAMAFIQAFFPDGDPRLMKLAGDAPYQLQEFMVADLNGAMDLKVTPGTGLPKSAAAVRAEARELWELGALTDEFGRPDVKKLLTAYNVGSTEQLYEEDQLDKQNARTAEEFILSLPPEIAVAVVLQALEDMEASGGQFPQLQAPFGLNTYDNALVHEKSHRMRLKKIASEQQTPPEIVSLMELRWQSAAIAALPILSMTEPDVAAKFAAALAEEEGGGGGGEEEAEGGEEESDGES